MSQSNSSVRPTLATPTSSSLSPSPNLLRFLSPHASHRRAQSLPPAGSSVRPAAGPSFDEAFALLIAKIEAKQQRISSLEDTVACLSSQCDTQAQEISFYEEHYTLHHGPQHYPRTNFTPKPTFIGPWECIGGTYPVFAPVEAAWQQGSCGSLGGNVGKSPQGDGRQRALCLLHTLLGSGTGIPSGAGHPTSRSKEDSSPGAATTPMDKPTRIQGELLYCALIQSTGSQLDLALKHADRAVELARARDNADAATNEKLALPQEPATASSLEAKAQYWRGICLLSMEAWEGARWAFVLCGGLPGYERAVAEGRAVAESELARGSAEGKSEGVAGCSGDAKGCGSEVGEGGNERTEGCCEDGTGAKQVDKRTDGEEEDRQMEVEVERLELPWGIQGDGGGAGLGGKNLYC